VDLVKENAFMSLPEIAPMYAFAEQLAAYAISQKRGVRGRISIAAVRFDAECVHFDLIADRLTFLFDGRYTAEVRVEDAQPAETRCTIQLVSGRGAGRLAETLSGFLPDSWINALLTTWFPSVRREGAAFVISNRELAGSLLSSDQGP
jgi:hypothetical protein